MAQKELVPGIGCLSLAGVFTVPALQGQENWYRTGAG
jgi:hypothetical protein